MGVDHAPQIGVDLAHAVVHTRCRHTIATRRGWRIANEVVAFVNGKYEQRVALVNSVRCKAVEKLLECLIVGLQLLRVADFSRTIREVDVAGSAVAVVRIGDIGVGDRNSRLLHLRHPGKRNGSFHAIEAGETNMPGGVLNDIAVEIRHRSIFLDDWVDILGPEQTIEATVAAGLVGQ